MRIAIGQLWQETSTLSPVRTTRDDFEAFGVLRGDAIVEQMQDTNELGGFIQSLRAWPNNPEIIGLVRLPAWPAGLATRETFDWLQSELLTALNAALPVDGLLLALHGAMAADGHPDVEGEILAAARAIVGPQTPIVATLDLHANITRAMVQAADALVLYHTAPHVDVFETGQRGANVLRRILFEKARPTTAFQKVPCVLPAERANTEAASGISRELKQRLRELEQDPRVLSAGIATVQPWLDVPELGSAVIVTTDGETELATESCTELAVELWQRKEEYLPELLSVQEAVARAAQHPSGLVVLSDAADATTSGAPGDSVWILEALLKREWPRPVHVTLVSPETVVQAEQTGIGSRFQGDIGGVRDHRFGKMITITAEVERLFDARFVLSGHLGKNLPIDMGRSAVLKIGQVRIIITSRSGPHFAPDLFRVAGFDPYEAAVVVAKSPCGFRAVYEQRAAAIYSVRAPGCAPTDFWNYEYGHRPTPLWPWEEIGQWQPAPILIER